MSDLLPQVNPPKPSLIWLARLGQLGKGIIYTAIGLLSALAAYHGRGGAQDSRGALRAIVQQPFGRGLLIVIIVGLACYVLWRVLAGLLDLERKGSDAKGLLLRARMLFIGLIYSGVTLAAIKTFMGTARRGGGSDQMARDWTARALETPFGSWLVVLVGLGLLVGGLVQAYRAYCGKFRKKLSLGELSATAHTWVVRVSTFGLAARGVVFAIIGVFLIEAGWQSNPRRARGLGGALSALQEQSHGRVLFGVVAAGLAAYGVYCLVRARYGKWE